MIYFFVHNMDYRMNYSITTAFFITKSAVKFGISNHKVHFGNYHLGSKYIYHLDKAINTMYDDKYNV